MSLYPSEYKCNDRSNFEDFGRSLLTTVQNESTEGICTLSGGGASLLIRDQLHLQYDIFLGETLSYED